MGKIAIPNHISHSKLVYTGNKISTPYCPIDGIIYHMLMKPVEQLRLTDLRAAGCGLEGGWVVYFILSYLLCFDIFSSRFPKGVSSLDH